jgi:hypothetical protein
LIIRVNDCVFQNQYENNGGGAVNGASGHWYIEDTIFANCTNKPAGEWSNLNGALIRLFSITAVQEVDVWVHRCEFENVAGNWYSNSQICTIAIAAVNPNAHFSFRDSTYIWPIPYGLGDENSPLFRFGMYCTAVTFSNVTVLAQPDGERGSWLFSGDATVQIEHCIFTWTTGTPSGWYLMRGWGEVVIVNTNLTNLFRVYDIRSGTTRGAMNLILCALNGLKYLCYSSIAQTMYFLASTWIDRQSFDASGIIAGYIASSQVIPECSCWILDSSSKRGIRHKSWAGKFYIRAGNRGVMRYFYPG